MAYTLLQRLSSTNMTGNCKKHTKENGWDVKPLAKKIHFAFGVATHESGGAAKRQQGMYTSGNTVLWLKQIKGRTQTRFIFGKSGCLYQ